MHVYVHMCGYTYIIIYQIQVGIMYVCVCVYIYICMYTYAQFTDTHTHIHTYACIHTCMSVIPLWMLDHLWLGFIGRNFFCFFFTFESDKIVSALQCCAPKISVKSNYHLIRITVLHGKLKINHQSLIIYQLYAHAYLFNQPIFNSYVSLPEASGQIHMGVSWNGGTSSHHPI